MESLTLAGMNIGNIFLLGFFLNLLKGFLALTAAWVFLRIADRAMGLNFNEKIQNLDSVGFGIYSAGRWIGVAVILHVIFL